MWKQNPVLKLFLLLLLLLLLPATPAPGKEVRGAVAGNERWEGEIVLQGPVTVGPEAVLTISPGTRIRPARPEAGITVQGRMVVRGTAERPVVFAGVAGWTGIQLIEARAESSFELVRFEGAQTAISAIASAFAVRRCAFRDCGTAVKLLREGVPVIEDCRFADNGIGIESEMKSTATIRRNRFSGHRQTAVHSSHGSSGLIEGNLFDKNHQGIGLIQKYPGTISDNTFRENRTGIFCNQTQSTPHIRNNRFEKNENALVNFSFAYPAVEHNRFLDNVTAIRNDQFGSPRVARNLFRGNGTALFNNRKSNPQVEKNRLERNETAIFCDFSSYPRVRDNNFQGNRMGVKLGLQQSADWEKRSGSKGIMAKMAAARNTQNPLLAQAPTEFTDLVDVSGNWWGTDTALMQRAGGDGNLAFFHDRLDQPEVTYEGYGPEKYRLDRIVFAPWLDREVPDAGPEEAQ